MQTIFGIVGRDSVMQRLLLQPGCDDYLPIREVGRAGGKTCTRTCRVGIFSSAFSNCPLSIIRSNQSDVR